VKKKRRAHRYKMGAVAQMLVPVRQKGKKEQVNVQAFAQARGERGVFDSRSGKKRKRDGV